ncbi:ParB N-terminal domain-containing protein [Desulfofundulus sp. TPOSR]|uniref:ParB/RepB/Spo0J family partition protein n=1 Tax=Desulfofundulus sp. TPOSR TaxID=2714340 RepID=UPI0014087FD2|nr:ParB N-terminal domain-containing protein [Desulfofundulus sp. TPOSR]NHM28019.1 ParB N-terminal domain-containing protein [Desulfofundulus sp. TPOSR]
MVTIVPVDLLKPHPKNAEFFPDPLPEDIRQEMLEDIRENGIATPLILARDHTILAGHQRWEMARQLGLSHVPAIVRDVDPDSPEAVALLIKDNLLRRQLNDMQVARLIRALKEQYGVKRGGDRRSAEVQGSKGQNVLLKIAGEVGIGEKQVARLDKLNDLIPELQSLVASGKLGTTAAYSLAFLSPEEQRELLRVLGEAGLGSLSVREAQELKRELETTRREKESLARRLAELEEEKANLAWKVNEGGEEELEALRRELATRESELEALRARLRELEQKPVENVVEKVVFRTDPALEAELEAARAEAAKLLQEKEWFEGRFREVAQEKERKEAKIRGLEEEVEKLQRWLDHARSELKKERERPRPRFDVRKEEFRALAQKAQSAAFELTELLKKLEEQYSDELLAASRVRGGPDFEDIGDAVVNTTVFKVLKAALEMALKRIINIFELLEDGKPKLQLVKSKEKDGR